MAKKKEKKDYLLDLVTAYMKARAPKTKPMFCKDALKAVSPKDFEKNTLYAESKNVFISEQNEDRWQKYMEAFVNRIAEPVTVNEDPADEPEEKEDIPGDVDPYFRKGKYYAADDAGVELIHESELTQEELVLIKADKIEPAKVVN